MNKKEEKRYLREEVEKMIPEMDTKQILEKAITSPRQKDSHFSLRFNYKPVIAMSIIFLIALISIPILQTSNKNDKNEQLEQPGNNQEIYGFYGVIATSIINTEVDYNQVETSPYAVLVYYYQAFSDFSHIEGFTLENNSADFSLSLPENGVIAFDIHNEKYILYKNDNSSWELVDKEKKVIIEETQESYLIIYYYENDILIFSNRVIINENDKSLTLALNNNLEDMEYSFNYQDGDNETNTFYLENEYYEKSIAIEYDGFSKKYIIKDDSGDLDISIDKN